ncbi:polysaccharide deacetylase family protein [Myxococcus sp. K15C18031901]|uniref:polysaccharide deacetylase family protein n=1 Tax=Myxococcus dinghuensis TaxID=2906761 RepID=UPI0020A78763|nr:polysaccharide deacetylase family protein [Myxococcus dinghuensis]MCP3101902.1 polysaccharide deacetylase family protein [Myxococcus dinghuensis]
MNTPLLDWKRLVTPLLLLTLHSSALAAQPFQEGIVTITLDDGWATQFTYARAALNTRGIKATYGLISRALEQGWGGYMTTAQARTLVAEGNGIASHTLTHPDLTTLTPLELTAELKDSQAWLVNNLHLSAVPDFIVPYGRYDATVLSAVKQFYGSSRTVNGGRNFRDTVVYELYANDVARGVPVSTVVGWVDRAIAEKSWLILVFHEFSTGPLTRDTEYRASDFAAILDYVRTKGVRTVTLAQGLALTEGRTEPEASEGTPVYEDGLTSGFADWSWADHSLDEAVTVHAGSSAIRFEPDGWSGLLFHHSGIDLSQYQAIELWVHGGTTGGQQIRVVLHDGTDYLGTMRVDTAPGGPIVAGLWHKVTLSLDDMGVTSGILRDLYFQDDTGEDQAAVYLDDIVLVPR